MNIQVIHEHSVDMDLLPAKATILDLGCRFMNWTNHFRELGHTVHAVDIDDLQHGDYDRCAITNYTGMCGITHTGDPQGTKIGPGDSIRCYTLEDYMKLKKVEFFDLIKFDVEGSEVEIILSLEKAPSRSLSIEFHLHCGQEQEDVWQVIKKTEALGYKVEFWDYSEKHGAGFNVWDSLLILK